MADAIIIPNNKELVNTARRLHKQHGQLCARTHVLAAELDALFKDGLGLKLACQAREKAQLLAKLCLDKFKQKFLYPVKANMVFAWLPDHVFEHLTDKANFHTWPCRQEEEIFEHTLVRLVCSWKTSESDIYQFINLAKEVM